MFQNKEDERIKTCFIALGIDKPENAINIMLSELMRIEYDERIPEKREVTIQVKDDAQKVIVKTIVSLLKESQLQLSEENIENFINFKVGGYPETDEQSDNVINLVNFDFDKEKDKLISRCNSTLIGNAQVRDFLLREDSEERNQTSQTKFDSRILELQNQLQEVKEKIEEYQSSLLGIFRSDELEEFYDEEEILSEKLEKCQKQSERERSYKQYKNTQRKLKISGLFSKEDRLQSIKFMFTGKRERLLRGINMKGQEIVYFEEENQAQNSNNQSESIFDKYEIK